MKRSSGPSPPRRRMAVLLGLLAVALPPAHAVEARGIPDRIPLKEGRLEDPTLLPRALVHDLRDGIPAALVPGGVAVLEDRRGLLVDVRGTGRPTRRVRPRQPRVIEIEREGRIWPVLVFRLAGTWCAGPARVLEGRLGRETVQLIAAPGVAGEAPRWLRRDAGTFRPFDGVASQPTARGMVSVALLATPEGPVLDVREVVQPPGFAAAARAGLRAVNRFRDAVGLDPLDLDAARSAACASHAAYIALNPVDGLGHEEIEGRPGYSPEGREAARLGIMDITGDPALAVERLTATMLHRIPLVHGESQPLGVGVTDDPGGRVPHGDPGYTVLWAGQPCSETTLPILVPAPGQRDVPLEIVREIPTPAAVEELYDRPRGYPVSVSFLPQGADGTIRLHVDETDELVAGHCFTPARPVHPLHAHNACSMFFVAESPLQPATTYRVHVRIHGEDDGAEIVWRFHTTGQRGRRR